MNHLAKIQIEFLKEARNWDDLTINEQRKYLRDHHKSKHRLTAKKTVDVQKFTNNVVDSLKGLPFISNVTIDTNFQNDPRIRAEEKQLDSKKLHTYVTVSFNKDYLQFDAIAVSDKDVGKKYSTKMIEAVLKFVPVSLPIYLSDPYNVPFWRHIKHKYPKYSWRFDLNHFSTIHVEFFKYAVTAKDLLQRALVRHDTAAIDYWRNVLNRRERKKYPVVKMTKDEFEKFKTIDSRKDVVEIDRIKNKVEKKFKSVFNLPLPIDDFRSMQDLPDDIEKKVLKYHDGVPKYAFTAYDSIYLNVNAINEDEKYTRGLEHVISHEMGHVIFNKFRNDIVEIMDMYDLSDDYAEDFAEIIAFGVTGKLVDKNLKIFDEVKKILKKNHDSIVVDCIKNYLYKSNDDDNWKYFVDGQGMGDCQSITHDIARKFKDYGVKRVFGEIDTDEGRLTHHWVEINYEIYDFAKGSLDGYVDFDDVYEIEVIDDSIYHEL